MRRGVYDLPVSEALWRLLDPGDVVADVGANIGVYTCLAATRVGEKGKVVAFEPHPGVFEELKKNIELWSAQPQLGSISPRRAALSDCDGSLILAEPPTFREYRGRAFISNASGDNEGLGNSHSVRAERLDTVAEKEGQFDLMKIDVEGHEERVLYGAERTISPHGARDVIYEADSGQRSRLATQELQRRGYAVFRLSASWWGPCLHSLDGGKTVSGVNSSYLPVSNLATLNPSRARRRLKMPGWRCLSARLFDSSSSLLTAGSGQE